MDRRPFLGGRQLDLRPAATEARVDAAEARAPQAATGAARASTSPYTGTWDRRRAAHLVRRTGFGAVKRDVDLALNDGGATAAAERLIAEAKAQPLPDPPLWYSRNTSSSEIEKIYDIQRAWFESMRTGALREKMTLFWHNHFVTEYLAIQTKAPGSPPHLCYDYLTLLRKHALGNFKSFVHAVGLNPAMLVYLDGYVSEKNHANENYGRELLELFTMGQFDADGRPNYTEQDIKELARALTGWVVTGDGKAAFDPERHDAGSKSFLGRTGTYGYDQAVDVVFEARAEAIATYVCRKLYCFFVAAQPDPEIVEALAAQFVSGGFEIAPVVETLLSSEHFYDDTFAASRIKSPLELLIGFLREAELAPTTDMLEELRVRLAKLNQEVLNPPNVAGWPGLNPPGSDGAPGHRAWLTTSTLPDRWAALEGFIHGAAGPAYDPVQLAAKISDPSNPYRFPTDIAETFLAVPLEHAAIRGSDDPVPGSDRVPLPTSFAEGPAHSINLTKILLGSVPHYDWPYFTTIDEARQNGALTLMRGFVSYLVQLPEYQLT